MKTAHIYLAVIGLLMYNVFLIQRDEKMFKSYYHQKSQMEYKMTPNK